MHRQGHEPKAPPEADHRNPAEQSFKSGLTIPRIGGPFQHDWSGEEVREEHRGDLFRSHGVIERGEKLRRMGRNPFPLVRIEWGARAKCASGGESLGEGNRKPGGKGGSRGDRRFRVQGEPCRVRLIDERPEWSPTPDPRSRLGNPEFLEIRKCFTRRSEASVDGERISTVRSGILWNMHSAPR